METSDDAAVYRLTDEIATIQTVDFFTPVVDDPYTFGQIAAANALSDVYAMGGEPIIALNIVAFPNCLDPSILGDILRGGADKVMETGATLAGGHSIQDDEPKYGLCVTGLVHPDRVYKNYGAEPGDVLILTKQIGSGLINTAIKGGLASPEEMAESVLVMSSLNKAAKKASEGHTVHACTDVTGFGLAGHACEMAEASGVTLEIEAAKVPQIKGALDYAKMGLVPAGTYKNRQYRETQVDISGVEECYADLLFDPQTSGGLLFSIPEGEAESFLCDLKEQGLNTRAAVIGKVMPMAEKEIILK